MKWIFRDFWWKLASLLIACAMWFTLVGDQERTTTLNVPVELKGAPADLEISSDAPERVTLEVVGPSSKVRDLSESRVSVILDLSEFPQAGQRTFTVDASKVFLPQGVRLKRAVPAQIRLRLEDRITKEVPVRVSYSQQPPDGYRMLSEIVTPETVRIVGAENRVRRVTEAETDPIDLSKVVGPQEYRVNLYVNDPFVRLVDTTTVTVRVDVGIEPEPESTKTSTKKKR